MNFDQAFAVLIGHEGDFSDHADDPGGKTRYGVTEAVAREVGYRGDMREFPLELAKRIYQEKYWKPVRADELPNAVRYAMFDAAVNSGTTQAIRWLQRAVGVTDDGVFGPRTMAAVMAVDENRLKNVIIAQRLRFMTDLKNWHAFSRGWARRISSLLMM